MSAQSAAIRLVLTVSFLGVACTTNKVVPATDSHAAADHAVPPSSASSISAPTIADCRLMHQEHPRGSTARHDTESG